MPTENEITDIIDRLRYDAITQNDGGGSLGYCRVKYGDLLYVLRFIESLPRGTKQ